MKRVELVGFRDALGKNAVQMMNEQGWFRAQGQPQANGLGLARRHIERYPRTFRPALRGIYRFFNAIDHSLVKCVFRILAGSGGALPIPESFGVAVVFGEKKLRGSLHLKLVIAERRFLDLYDGLLL